MADYNTESNNSGPKQPRRFGDEVPTDPDRQEELVEKSIQHYLETQRYLRQEAEEYLYRSVYYDHFGVGYGDE